jgi:N-acetylmuramate 1-kinase
MPQRLERLKTWLSAEAGLPACEIAPASGDASFRRYFRVTLPDGSSRIVMDAPPEREDCRPFVALARTLRELGLNAPQIHAEDLAQGFLLLDDLGTCPYLDALQEPASVERLYGDALGALVAIQACGPREGLPPYDRRLLLAEMALFRDWLVGEKLRLAISPAEDALLDAAFDRLADNALEQPQVCVHRDYHSRNLMVTPSPNPGILDFQDAVIGPVTYDLVSLLRDCYIRWPRERVEEWAMGYFHLAVQSGVCGRRTRAASCAGSTSWASSATSRPPASSPGWTGGTARPATSRISRAPSAISSRWRPPIRNWPPSAASWRSGCCRRARRFYEALPALPTHPAAFQGSNTWFNGLGACRT